MIIIVLFALMFACMAAVYLAFIVLMVWAAITKFNDMFEGKPDEPSLPAHSATAVSATVVTAKTGL
jgi:hypothetical protein